MTTFNDHFSDAPDSYKTYRPEYPQALFSQLAALTQSQQLVWDCGTGNGQAARALSAYFEQVVASDASAAQIEQAEACDRVEYRVAPAEHSGLADKSVDLMTVAQAFHWFDAPAFFVECQRVAKPGAVLALWSYKLLGINAEVDAIVSNLHRNTVGAYWPPQRALVESGYSDIEVPFKEIKTQPVTMTAKWDLAHLVGYLRTWSAVKKYQAETGIDPVAELLPELAEIWGEPRRTKQVSWPLPLRVFRLA